MVRLSIVMLSKEAFLELEKSLKNYGGFSVKALTSLGYEPLKYSYGYLVSIKKYEDYFSLDDFTYERVKSYLAKKGLEDSLEPLYFGAWYSEDEGLVYLDFNKHIIFMSHAIREGLAQNQKAIYDLKNAKSIYLKDINLLELLAND